MKKFSVIMLALVLVFAVGTMVSAQTAWENGNFIIKGGMDFNGNIDVEKGDDHDVDSALSLTGEYLVPVQNNLSYGVGLTYQLQRDIDEDDAPEFNFIPFYGVIKYQTQMNSEYAPYFLGQLGYNSFDMDDVDGDCNGGLYYGIGAGMEISKDLDVELLYSVNNGEIDPDAEDAYDVDYSKLRLGVSYSF